MKIFRHILPGLFALSVCLSSPVWAQDAAVETTEQTTTEVQPTNKVMEALVQTTFVNGSCSSPQAKYVVFLNCMNWCSASDSDMAEVGKAYVEMAQEGKVELVLVSADATEEDAKAYAERYKLNCPTLTKAAAAAIPGYSTPIMYPSVLVVDGEGKEACSGSIDLISKYKAYISKYEVDSGLELTFKPDVTKTDEEDESSSGCKNSTALADAISRLSVFNKNSVNADADYYILYFGSSTCCSCISRLPDAAAFYAEMEADGRVEMLYVTYDKSKGTAKRFFARENATFPAVLQEDRAVRKLPGYASMCTFPSVLILDKGGKEIIRGSASKLLPKWKELTVGK